MARPRRVVLLIGLRQAFQRANTGAVLGALDQLDTETLFRLWRVLTHSSAGWHPSEGD